jgi:hypothetical protein
MYAHEDAFSCRAASNVRQAKGEQPVLGLQVGMVHELLEMDKQAPKKQRNTARRIFGRLKVEGAIPAAPRP